MVIARLEYNSDKTYRDMHIACTDLNIFIFRIIGPYEHNNQTSNKVNNGINNNQ
jgi:hypothetical protein